MYVLCNVYSWMRFIHVFCYILNKTMNGLYVGAHAVMQTESHLSY